MTLIANTLKYSIDYTAEILKEHAQLPDFGAGRMGKVELGKAAAC